MWSDDVIMSPESTVTSLLATSGHLQSSLHPEPVSTITYRDKRYVSASAALDAYITDFQKSLRDNETTTGKLKVTKELSKPHPRNRDVLKTSLTEGELNFLNIPIKKRDSDRLSMTTDDLLALPTDGSLPVTRTSALLSQSGILLLGQSFNSSARSHSRPSGAPKRVLRPPHQRAPSTGRPSASRTSLPVDDLLIGGLRSQHQGPSPIVQPHTPRSHYLPRWMTSQKSEMDFSGMTSVPDLKYPGWLGQCEESLSGSGQIPPPLRVPSWVAELEENREVTQSDTEGHRDVKSHSGELCEPRKMCLQCSEAVKKQEQQDGQLFEDDRIDSLIFRAEQMLNSSPVKGHDRSGDTDDSLDADRSWDNPPVTFKSPVPVGSADEPQQPDELQRNKSACSSGYSSRRHPGPVEALKHMLLRLQAVEHNISQSNTTHSQREPEEQLDTEEHETSGESLQRALHHLERLKTLVDDMNERSETCS